MKTMSDDFKEFHDRCVELFVLICKELKIDKVVQWLDNVLRNFEK